MANLDQIMDYLADRSDSDYITSQGNSGAWYYRKWASGKEEAWAYVTSSSTAGSQWAGIIYNADVAFTIPDGVFSAAPNRAYVTAANLQWAVSGVTSMTKTSITVRLIKPVTTSQAVAVYLYLVKL